mmetsp:Transcript_15266/g.32983  ORF Transcript_15266/g.32983 Transcript_15266/m.32983 type:complete len:378 (-) Transcript_15266:139-1272(-)
MVKHNGCELRVPGDDRYDPTKGWNPPLDAKKKNGPRRKVKPYYDLISDAQRKIRIDKWKEEMKEQEHRDSEAARIKKFRAKKKAAEASGDATPGTPGAKTARSDATGITNEDLAFHVAEFAKSAKKATENFDELAEKTNKNFDVLAEHAKKTDKKFETVAHAVDKLAENAKKTDKTFEKLAKTAEKTEKTVEKLAKKTEDRFEQQGAEITGLRIRIDDQGAALSEVKSSLKEMASTPTSTRSDKNFFDYNSPTRNLTQDFSAVAHNRPVPVSASKMKATPRGARAASATPRGARAASGGLPVTSSGMPTPLPKKDRAHWSAIAQAKEGQQRQAQSQNDVDQRSRTAPVNNEGSNWLRDRLENLLAIVLAFVFVMYFF